MFCQHGAVIFTNETFPNSYEICYLDFIVFNQLILEPIWNSLSCEIFTIFQYFIVYTGCPISLDGFQWKLFGY